MRDKRFDDWWETFAPDGDTFGVVPFDAALTAWNAALASRAKGEVPESFCMYCGMAPDHKHADGTDCCGDCCATHGSLVSDKPAYELVSTMHRRMREAYAQIAELRAQVEQIKQRSDVARKADLDAMETTVIAPLRAALATAEESGIRKALEWISVEDKTPPLAAENCCMDKSEYGRYSDLVYVFSEDGDCQFVAAYDGLTEEWSDARNGGGLFGVTHWMPLHANPEFPALLPSAESASKEPK